jgi:hypothetical protein
MPNLLIVSALSFIRRAYATDLSDQSASYMPTLPRAGDKKLLFQAIPKSRLSSDLLEQKTTLWRAEVSRSVKKRQFQGVLNMLFPYVIS